MSSSIHTEEVERNFRYATVKVSLKRYIMIKPFKYASTCNKQMAVMVYKEMIFATRKKPKGLLRPKARANLKDIQNVGH